MVAWNMSLHVRPQHQKRETYPEGPFWETLGTADRGILPLCLPWGCPHPPGCDPQGQVCGPGEHQLQDQVGV